MSNHENDRKKLRYEKELSPFSDYIDTHYSESDLTVFRNTLTNPPSPDDSIPQIKRDMEGHSSELELEFTEEEVAEMTEQDKKDFVAERAISVFKTAEKCRASVKDIVRHIFRKSSYDEALFYLQNRRGPYIEEIKLTEDVGLLECRFNKKGHANLLLYEGVDIRDYTVRMADYVGIDELLPPAEKERKENEDVCDS